MYRSSHQQYRLRGREYYIVPEASSAEVFNRLLEDEKIDKDCASYMSIIHDTGVFQYKNTPVHR